MKETEIEQLIGEKLGHFLGEDGIVVIDGQGSILYMNPTAAGIFGLEHRKGMDGHNIMELMPERFHKKHATGLARFRDTGKSKLDGKTVRVYGKRIDGKEVPIELTIRRLIANLFAAKIFDLGKKPDFEWK